MVMPAAPNTLDTTDPTIVYFVDLLRLRSVCKLSTYWINESRVRAKRIARYRKYFDGDHDAKLTPEMKALLRITDNDDGFTLNMMPAVVDTKADRCIVQSIDAVTDQPAEQQPPEDRAILKDPHSNPSAWIQEVMETNRFDILQGEVHQASVMDGDAFLMVSWDNDKQQVKWTFEEAFDGNTGMLAVYPSRNVTEMSMAIKIWQIDDPDLVTPDQIGGQASTTQDASAQSIQHTPDRVMTRVNIYYSDRVEKYFSISVGAFQPYLEPGSESHIHPWIDRAGNPLGIPVFHFRNGGRHNFGTSELRNALSPQNALNRFNYSAVMIAELTGFAILVARGHEPPKTITPAMIYKISSAPLENGQIADLTRLAAGDLKPILEIIDKERHLIADITRTPSPDLMGGAGGNKTGEYLKQLEIGLLGKVRSFQVRAGATWEGVADMSHEVETAFGPVQPPAYKRFLTKWRSAELRNNAEMVQSAVLMDPIWGHEQTLHATASVFELDEDSIARIVTQQKEEIAKAQAMQGGIQTTVNPGKGTVQVSEPKEVIGAAPANNSPAVRGQKLPADQALKVNPIHPDELAAVGAMHRKMVATP